MKKSFMLIMVLLLVVVLTGCGGGGGQPKPTVELDPLITMWDTSFDHLGFWRSKMVEDGYDNKQNNFQVFDYAPLVFWDEKSNNYIASLEGDVQYNGLATGVYKHNNEKDFGLFTAEVNMLASFNPGGGQTSNIEGKISNFQRENGQFFDSDWQVEFDPTNFTYEGKYIGIQADLLTTGNGGKLYGGFYRGDVGNTYATDQAPGFIPPPPVAPDGVAGTFDANFQTGYVNGAFGATTRFVR